MAKLYNLARMTVGSTGTGTITLGSAVNGFLSFAASGVSNGEIVTYAIKDGNNSEIGRGVYTSSGTTLTRSVLRSTNSNSAINLTSGAEVFISAAAEDFLLMPNTTGEFGVRLAAGTNVTANRTLTVTTGDANRTLDISAGNVTVSSAGAALIDDADAAAQRVTLGVRDVLAANRTYYVRTDGSDSNTGLVNNSGGAFLTIQKAIDAAAALDVGIYDVTITVGAGTFTGALTLKDPIGAGLARLGGAGATTIVSTTSANAINVSTSRKYVLSNMKLETTTSGSCIYAANAGAYLQTLGGLEFGAAAAWHMFCSAGSVIAMSSSYSISGGALNHWLCDNGGTITAGGITITLSGTPAFGSAFASATNLSLLRINGNTFSGSATGVRYSVTGNAVIFTNSGGGSYVPGSSAGSTADGGLYR